MANCLRSPPLLTTNSKLSSKQRKHVPAVDAPPSSLGCAESSRKTAVVADEWTDTPMLNVRKALCMMNWQCSTRLHVCQWHADPRVFSIFARSGHAPVHQAQKGPFAWARVAYNRLEIKSKWPVANELAGYASLAAVSLEQGQPLKCGAVVQDSTLPSYTSCLQQFIQ
ncbi:hypothetical protein BT63DRAFT_449349 [Microthyrium microscopicum]|uniref:Uncharacterized protein n=1 Tax=Microthyrium microscopicum TaxID=703497 RepID=A0A6A6USH2_9PEZI|nr:hypothetical protein BT63DRAFT_449349 [Microthyrium microscopicum]